MTTHFLLAYAAVISIISASLTAYDKAAAKSKKRRIPESVLLLIAVIGGGAAELLTMLLIRHKTNHIKFMILLPLIIFLQFILLLFAYHGEYIIF